MARALKPDSECPCGSDGSFGSCCAPVLRDARLAATAEQLMRSRYTAHVVGDDGHLFRTWHPRTRPSDVAAGDVEWLGLTILNVLDGEPGDGYGVVEFEAAYRGGVLRERSEFRWRAGRWLYVGALEGEDR